MHFVHASFQFRRYNSQDGRIHINLNFHLTVVDRFYSIKNNRFEKNNMRSTTTMWTEKKTIKPDNINRYVFYGTASFRKTHTTDLNNVVIAPSLCPRRHSIINAKYNNNVFIFSPVTAVTRVFSSYALGNIDLNRKKYLVFNYTVGTPDCPGWTASRRKYF